jgi:hypothetical protein
MKKRSSRRAPQVLPQAESRRADGLGAFGSTGIEREHIWAQGKQVGRQVSYENMHEHSHKSICHILICYTWSLWDAKMTGC